jgi:hypothetical protein
MDQPNRRSPTLSPALAWSLLAVGAGMALWRGSLAIYWLRQWYAARVTDPSGAELYQMSFWLELAFAAITLAIGLGAFRMLPRRSPRQDRPTGGGPE